MNLGAIWVFIFILCFDFIWYFRGSISLFVRSWDNGGWTHRWGGLPPCHKCRASFSHYRHFSTAAGPLSFFSRWSSLEFRVFIFVLFIHNLYRMPGYSDRDRGRDRDRGWAHFLLFYAVSPTNGRPGSTADGEENGRRGFSV